MHSTPESEPVSTFSPAGITVTVNVSTAPQAPPAPSTPSPAPSTPPPSWGTLRAICGIAAWLLGAGIVLGVVMLGGPVSISLF